MSRGRKVLISFIAALLGLCVGCSSSDTTVVPPPAESGQALLKVVATAESPFARLAHRADVTVSAADMQTINAALIVTDTSVEGAISGIPAGRERLFEIAVYDSADTVQYRGSATADVIADSAVDVTIDIARVSGAVRIGGRIVDTTTIDSVPECSDDIAQIVVLRPTREDTLTVGRPFTLRWCLPSTIVVAFIEYSTDGGDTWRAPVAEGVLWPTNTFSFTPQAADLGTTCLVRVGEYGNMDATMSYSDEFVITSE